MADKKIITPEELRKKEIELVLLRLGTVSPEVYFSSGNGTNISRNEMIQHVKRNDDTGKEFIDTEMEFLRAFKNGEFLKQILATQISPITSIV